MSLIRSLQIGTATILSSTLFAQVPVGIDREQTLTVNLGAIHSQYTQIPVFIDWNPNSLLSKGVLGGAWSFPVFDSFIVPSDSGTFQWQTLSGKTTIIDPRDITTGIQVRTVGHNSLIVTDRFGWKFVYSNGKIHSFSTPADENFYVERDVNNDVALRNNSKVVLSFSERKGICTGDRCFKIEFGRLAKWRLISGLSVIDTVDQSCVSISENGFQIIRISDEPGSVPLRIIDIGGDKNVLHFSEGKWSPYGKQKVRTESDNGNITTKDGLVRMIAENGLCFERSIFQSGILSGKVRFERVTNLNTGEIVSRKYRYDERGLLIGTSE